MRSPGTIRSGLLVFFWCICRPQWWQLGRVGVATLQGEQECRLDGGHRDPLVKQLDGELTIGGRGAAQRGLRQAAVEVEAERWCRRPGSWLSLAAGATARRAPPPALLPPGGQPPPPGPPR